MSETFETHYEIRRYLVDNSLVPGLPTILLGLH